VAWYDPCIERVPGVQGGAPVIRGTRTPVRTIVGYAHAYQGDLNDVCAVLSHLSPEQGNHHLVGDVGGRRIAVVLKGDPPADPPTVITVFEM
jgi:uncharacterized protein (DUF433 family)